jgi:hypothetical protein
MRMRRRRRRRRRRRICEGTLEFVRIQPCFFCFGQDHIIGRLVRMNQSWINECNSRI